MNDQIQDASLSLSQWASGVTGTDVPDHVRHIVRTCVVDTIGVAVAGSGTGVAAMARQVAKQNACRGSADVLGSGTTASAATAAFCNTSDSRPGAMAPCPIGQRVVGWPQLTPRTCSA